MKTVIIITFLFISCDSHNPIGKKVIDTGKFEIEVPENWYYKKESGVDSFVGSIKSKEFSLNFDWSEFGYANHLILSEKEYIYETSHQWKPYTKEKELLLGVIYTSGDVIGERNRIMKEKGIADTSLVVVQKHLTPIEKIIKEDNIYYVILTYKDTSIKSIIIIPEEVNNHIVEIDTIGKYKRKIIRPIKGINGTTGVYFEDLNSGFNFNLYGENLSLKNQEKVIVSFKTINLKR